MQEHQVDGIYLIPGRNQSYFSGYTGWGGWPTRLGSYILPLNGDPVRVTLPMYEEFVKGHSGETLGKKFYLYTNGDEKKAKIQLKKALKELKLDKGTIGVEEEIRHTDYLLLKEAAPDATIINVSKTLLDPLRMIKDEQEIALVRKSAEIKDKFFNKATEIITEGVSINDVRLELATFIAKCGGGGSRIPKLANPDRKIQKGEVFDFEPAGSASGYGAETARTFFVGEATKRERQIHITCMKAYEAAEQLVKPGVTMHELHVAATKVMKEGLKGIFPNFEFTRRLGHGVGLSGGGHEIPYVQEFNMMEEAVGMTHVIDAGPGPGAIQKQDSSGFGHGSVAGGLASTILIKEDGFERLSKFTHDLMIL